MSKNFSEGLIEEISQNNDIVHIVSKYVELKRMGKNYKGLCPFHNENTPSFMVSEDKQLYHCFGCGEGGDVINFIMKIENLDFTDAIMHLAEVANIDVSRYMGNNKRNGGSIDDKKLLYSINRDAAMFFYKTLISNENEGLNYFKNRGFEESTIKSFGLGFAFNDWRRLNNYLLSRGYSEKMILKTGLVIKNEKGNQYDRFRNRVMFPIINTTKKVLGFGGRVLDDSKPKYLNSPESSIFNKRNILYGLNISKADASKTRKLIVVEGYTDVIMLNQHGIRNAVATLGTSLTAQHAKLMKRYSDEVIICYDADSAGESATIKGMEIVKEAGLDVKVLRLKDNLDPDEFVSRFGKDSYIDAINNSMTLIDYKIDLLINSHKLDTNEGRIAFVSEVTKLLETLKTQYEKDLYSKRISNLSGIELKVIKTEVYGNNRYDKKPYKGPYKKANQKDKRLSKIVSSPPKIFNKNGVLELEKKIIAMAIADRNTFMKISKLISVDEFMIDEAKRIYKAVDNIYINTNTSNMTYDEILMDLDIEDAKKLREIKELNIPLEDFNGACYHHRLHYIKYQIDALNEKLILLDRENKARRDVTKIKELQTIQRDISDLQKELSQLRMNPNILGGREVK